MIKDFQIYRKDGNVLLGIAVDNAVLDVLTNDDQIQSCLKFLQEPHQGFVCAKLGTFGIYAVTLGLGYDDSVTIFVDGPETIRSRSQSAGIYLEKEELQRVLVEALKST